MNAIERRLAVFRQWLMPQPTYTTVTTASRDRTLAGKKRVRARKAARRG